MTTPPSQPPRPTAAQLAAGTPDATLPAASVGATPRTEPCQRCGRMIAWVYPSHVCPALDEAHASLPSLPAGGSDAGGAARLRFEAIALTCEQKSAWLRTHNLGAGAHARMLCYAEIARDLRDALKETP